MIYAGGVPPIEQSESVMYGYKRAPIIRPAAAYNVVALLAYLAIRGHLQCPASHRTTTHPLVDGSVADWAPTPAPAARACSGHQ